ncbi:MAG: aminodeoxychorismate synthase component I [Gammaproteobacteria bacterium]|nr:aminodeoxychorismate synthase component I [Gammaproteobacteria bacterium]
MAISTPHIGDTLSESGLQVSELAGIDDLLRLHSLRPTRYPFLLESAAHGTPQGRYDILFAFPGRCLRARPESDFLSELDAHWLRERRAPNPHDVRWPFRGGWFVYLGYELAGQVEPVLRLEAFPGVPMAFACRVPSAVIRDRASGNCVLVQEKGAGIDPALVIADIENCGAIDDNRKLLAGDLKEAPAEAYLRAVERAREYIRAGDVFQANLARHWEAELLAGVRGAELYRRLRVSNPGPFCGLAEWDDWSVVSSSPERLLRIEAGRVETRPIAGTRPRGLHAAGDRALSRELISHPKERAEHVMLIDLERNDLGRICVPGSVEVDEMMVIESYAHVHHIVSNVRGSLRAGVKPGEAIRAVFPGGTITGCPKVRCMEIISELEAAPRGPYTGSMGYLNLDGSLDLNILIRTLVRRGRRLGFSAGAGIVADSVAELELAETRAKAEGLVRALSEGDS